ncbi:MAG TPA: hypothetical protein DCL86_03470, partial [Bacteroidales bacterium]|nr:hypothetical protein [Bacteroidales bacterium]
AWKPKRKKKGQNPAALVMLLLLLLPVTKGIAQQAPLSMNEAISIALNNNPGIKAAAFEVESARQMARAAFDPDKATVYY